MAEGPNKKKDQRSRLMPVANVLQSVLGNGKSPLSEQFTRWKLWRCWPEVVGPNIASSTQPVSYHKGRLYIWVRSSTQMQELRFLVGDIKDRINDYLGREYVKFIQFTLDQKSVPQDPKDQQEIADSLNRTGVFLPEKEDSID